MGGNLQTKDYKEWQQAINPTKFGLGSIIDWDNEAMAAIEGINSAKFGGIDRKTSPLWRTKEY